ncbi:MAG: TIGR03560 family F420-dependent LLM class oxidoreductase [Streptosporangiales bacterium]|nr:TIGR03560 family F420-dependent LLM class oxidoreductase [Streptosporangiales bacterium]
MRISISLTNHSWPGGAAALRTAAGRTAQLAEEVGVYAVWVADHLMQAEPGTQPDEPLLEAYTTLGYLAAKTERVELGSMVSPVTFREPALLVKAVTSLDVLSGGRAWCGLGIGHTGDTEGRFFGMPFPPVAERFERMEETLRLARQMWAGDESPFDGAHYRLERPLNRPNSLRRPHPPIVVGGMGEKQTLRLVAQYADACNIFDIPDGGAAAKRALDALARHCDAVGRPYDEIERTMATRLEPGESADSFARRCEAIRRLGIDHVMVITTGAWTEPAVRSLGTVVAA